MTVRTESIYNPSRAAWEALWAAWRTPGGVPLVLVLGQDGVGKSALLEHFAAGVRRDPDREQVLMDRWSPDEFDPFAPFLAQLGLTYILGRLVPGVPRKAMHWAIKLTMPNVPIVGERLGGILEEEVTELLDKKPVASDPGTMLRLRQQIADAIAVEGFGELAAVIRAARHDADTAGDALTRTAQAYLSFARDNPAVYDAMFTRATALRFAADDTPPALTAAFTELHQAVGLVADEKDVDSLTEVLWAALHGLVTLSRTDRLRPGYDSERVALLVHHVIG